MTEYGEAPLASFAYERGYSLGSDMAPDGRKESSGTLDMVSVICAAATRIAAEHLNKAGGPLVLGLDDGLSLLLFVDNRGRKD